MKKLSLSLALVMLLFSVNIVPASADATVAEVAVTAASADEQIALRADVIVNVYRTHDGIPQFRRWNETRGFWVDPDWINLIDPD